jgi:hypothetical protein
MEGKPQSGPRARRPQAGAKEEATASDDGTQPSHTKWRENHSRAQGPGGRRPAPRKKRQLLTTALSLQPQLLTTALSLPLWRENFKKIYWVYTERPIAERRGGPLF